MDYLITKRIPCSVCGFLTFRHEGWFLVIENRWLDSLRIFTWHSSLAMQNDVKSACCRLHLKTLIAHWLDKASLRLLPRAENLPMPIAGAPARADIDLGPHSFGRLIGELSVHRETFSRGWTGSPATLECILEALIPVADESKTRTMDFQLFDSPPEPSHGLALH